MLKSGVSTRYKPGADWNRDSKSGVARNVGESTMPVASESLLRESYSPAWNVATGYNCLSSVIVTRDAPASLSNTSGYPLVCSFVLRRTVSYNLAVLSMLCRGTFREHKAALFFLRHVLSSSRPKDLWADSPKVMPLRCPRLEKGRSSSGTTPRNRPSFRLPGNPL